MGFINIGFGNIINDDKIITIVSPDSAPARRFVQNAKEKDMVIDATQGRRTRAIITTDSGYIVLSAPLPDTIAGRVKNKSEQSIGGESDEQR